MKRPFDRVVRIGLVMLVGAATSVLAQGRPPREAPAATGASPGRVPEGQCVEPLSVPLRLSMTADEVFRALGKPPSDNRAFGGGVGYPGLRLTFDTAGREIWSLAITGDTRLACGLAVGDPLASARAAFPGGTMVYETYQVRVGPYELAFRATSAGIVDQIGIRPSGRRFDDLRPGAASATAAAAVDIRSLAGQWIDPKNAQSFEIRPDGRYRTGVGAEGQVVATPEGLTFSGPLSAWNRGKATVTPDGKAIEFHWTSAEGFKQYFAFLRASSAGR